jgi:hypothetical protein
VQFSNITYGQSFDINTDNAATGMTAVLIRPSATTHANDFEQRYVSLTVNQITPNVKINVSAPPNANVAPPGYYMLVILNSSGIPSVSYITPAGLFLQLTTQ